MELLNERNQIRSLTKRWNNQYGNTKSGQYKVGGTIDNKISLLDPETATAKDVLEIIGNSSWIEKNQCNECEEKSWDIVEIGEDPDYESETAYICRKCLVKAIELIDDKPLYLGEYIMNTETERLKVLIEYLIPDMNSRIEGLKTLWPGTDTLAAIDRNKYLLEEMKKIVRNP